MSNRKRGKASSHGKTQWIAAVSVLSFAAAFTLSAPPKALADECLLDNGVVDGLADGADTDGGAVSNNDPDNLACGVNATATGNSSTAVGADATATGSLSTAVGAAATATGSSSTAVGADALADGDFSTAVGDLATATADGSTALGAGAVATLPGEFVLGTTSNTYTLPGIASRLSRERQIGNTGIVTTDAFGNLATDGGALFNDMAQVQAGVALAMAFEAPDLKSTDNFAMRIGYGNFEGDSHALGISAIGSLDLNIGDVKRWSWDAAFGAGWSESFNYDSGETWGGRAGIQMAW